MLYYGHPTKLTKDTERLITLYDKQEINYSKEFLKNHHLLEPYLEQKVIKQLIDISAGWYRIEEKMKCFFGI